jgi:protein-S-isoprenylcysteine O-methyltransferase Ste14
MRATSWEFTNRALIIGLIFAFSFPLYWIDHQNATAVFGGWLSARLNVNADLVAHLLFALAAVVLIAGALIRTWASSYLHSEVVYASVVKTDSLIADGPYRHVRNPLYFANVLLALGLGAMMSRPGIALALTATLVFCYRLILREEAELQASQGERYARYRHAVPRLWPTLRPRIPSSGRQARWSQGFRAEAWYWGFAASLVVFAITLNLTLFFVILAASVALLWVSSMLVKNKAKSAARRQAPS